MCFKHFHAEQMTRITINWPCVYTEVVTGTAHRSNKKHLKEFQTPVPSREISIIYHKSQLKIQLIEVLKTTIDQIVKRLISFSDVKIISPLQKIKEGL